MKVSMLFKLETLLLISLFHMHPRVDYRCQDVLLNFSAISR